MQKISAVVSFLAVLISCVSGECFYTIVAPENIRPHSDYRIAVTLHNDVVPVTVRFTITDGLSYAISETVNINSNRTELVTLRIDDLPLSGYKLVAEGLSGATFKNESNLKIESKQVSIFIQTDKSIYKPGESIKFRVLVLDSALKPVSLAENQLLDIHFVDPQKNRIKQWLHVIPIKGVFTSEIQLSELPILGTWQFKANIGKDSKTKSVDVAEYVLPKFQVDIDCPTEFSVKDGTIRAIIRSKYTYGKLVKGEAIIKVSQKSNFGYYGQPTGKIVGTKASINGKASVEFDIERDLGIQFADMQDDMVIYDQTHSFDIEATVVEELTGRNHSASKRITIHQSRYKITTADVKRTFVPGEPISFSLVVALHDNSPVLINEMTKSITVASVNNRRFSKSQRIIEYSFELDSNGTAEITIPTLANDTGFYLQIRYMSELTYLDYFYTQDPGKPSALEVNVLTTRPTLGENIIVEVRSNEFLQNVTYIAIAHGKIMNAKSVDVPDLKSYSFKIRATFDLVPKVTIIVYRFKNDDFVAKKVDVEIREHLNNFVKLKLSTGETQPGQEVGIEVITNPESYVGLMGVDQSVLLLKKNDGLTKENAFEEMEDYQEQFFNAGPGPWTAPEQPYRNDFAMFRQSHVILFTNAKIKRRYQYENQYSAGIMYDEVSYSSSPLERPPENPVEPPRIRTEFPETIFWEDFNITEPDGILTISRKMPDTITSWVISAFSVDPKTGLGLTREPKSLKVFQPFFISLNLPFSVKRGEVVAVPVVLFNYMDTNVVANLILHNENGEFEFVDDDRSNQRSRHRQVDVASDAGIASTFLIRFTAVGQIPLKISATSAIAADAIVRILQVDPEGVPQYVNKVSFIDLRNTNHLDITETIDAPANAVPQSLKINVNVIGDLLGGTIENLHQLIRLPTGCGEQNMLKFVPNIVVLDYLHAAGNVDEKVKDKTVKFLESGYQQELKYRHPDGSYSAFGGSYGSGGSTWLTAFVVKSFKQAEKYIDIDSKVIDEGLNYLQSVQDGSDGSFPENGYILDRKMQGGSNKGIALTAYVAITFLQNEEQNGMHQDIIRKAIDNVATNVHDIDDVYTLAITAYALQLAGHVMKDDILDKLVAKAIENGGHKWWTRAKPGSQFDDSKSIDVEITSYGVLALIAANRNTDAFPFFKWLLAQRNDRGGFVGTQDTVLGLEALAAYGRLLSSKNSDVLLKCRTNISDEQSFSVNAENAFVLQSVDLPPYTESVHVTASGKGFAIFQVSYRYNVNEKDLRSVFTLTPTVLETTTPAILNVKTCASFNPETEDDKSNMVIMEVAMPSGYLIEKDQLDKLMAKPNVKLVETKRGETVADIYIDQMTPNEQLCFEVQGYRSHKVAENKPVPVRIYDYYDDSRNAREFYQIASVGSCEICDGDECSRSCDSK
ncbi:CD109 antigen-like [Bradysia coprophila]|uniref:CD109 antigen-like n=1 Tax=Bradysia coprophila TaxID=38358 RepID=UPI00187D9A33|nr:CD109 antigen-like [Bradysia coprophila]